MSLTHFVCLSDAALEVFQEADSGVSEFIAAQLDCQEFELNVLPWFTKVIGSDGVTRDLSRFEVHTKTGIEASIRVRTDKILKTPTGDQSRWAYRTFTPNSEESVEEASLVEGISSFYEATKEMPRRDGVIGDIIPVKGAPTPRMYLDFPRGEAAMIIGSWSEKTSRDGSNSYFKLESLYLLNTRVALAAASAFKTGIPQAAALFAKA